MGFHETLNWFYEYVFMGRGVRWHNFPDMGKGEQWYSYYYAENRLYIIRDGMTDQLYFVKTGSPREAYLEFFRRMEEAQNAGSYVNEDEEV
ncbi:hypothetical protein [Porcincola intestinalis]|uniref:hypothetical protein n=1 Tax=Porcincola intestinalis TaxID=2606632 RepID=UPI002A840C15|nr:hypothetical protein [Porcincola intestinalis]MDY4205520.1 hypothetical protein [Porcincola intestinalis]